MSFKPGAPPTATSFKVGMTNNPGGRRKDPEAFAAFRERCRALEPEAMEALKAKLAEGDLKAVEMVLHYAWGKPPQTVTVEGDAEAPLAIKWIVIDPSQRDPDA